MKKYLQMEGWDWAPDCGYAPPGVCFGGGESSSQQSSQQSSQSLAESLQETIPLNLQNPADTANAGNTVSGLNQIVAMLQGGGAAGNSLLGSFLAPYGGNFSAPTTANQNQTLANLQSAEGGADWQFNDNLAQILSQLQTESTNPGGFAASLANGLPQNPTVAAEAANPVGTGQAFESGLQINPQLAAQGANPTGFAQSVENALQIDPTLLAEENPNFAAGLATSPQTTSAIGAALRPIQATFNAQTVPGLQQSFAQAGQRTGAVGSSAFDEAFGNAQAQEQATEAATAGQIANNAYETGLNITAGAANAVGTEKAGAFGTGLTAAEQALQEIQQQQGTAYQTGIAAGTNAAQTLQQDLAGAYGTGLNLAGSAPSQYAGLTSGEVQQLISTLNAQALPQLTQQLGINNSLSTYNQAISSIMQALGLQVQAEQPVIGYESGSESAQESTSQGTSQGSSSAANFNLAPLFP